MSLLKVALFGRFCVQCGDQIVGGFDASKVQELFTYLLLYRHRSHPRETLAGILWGDSSTAQSKKYLRQALWQMQSALEASTTIAAEDLFLLEANWINLNPAAPLWLDVAAFETAYNRVQGVPGQALDGQQLKTVHDAVELYRGDLLEGWYQDWCWYERERFQTMYLSLLDKLIDYYQANGEYETAIDYAQRVLRCDHAREHTHQRLMILHYLAGDRVAALRQYERCCTALDDELSVSPSRQTEALYRQIQLDQPGDALPNPGSAVAVVRAPLPGEVLGRLEQLWTTIADLQRQLEQEILAVKQTLNSRG